MDFSLETRALFQRAQFLSTLSWIELHAAEVLIEFVGIFGIREAVHMKPFAVVVNGVAAGAECQVLAEIMNLLVAPFSQKRAGNAIW